MNPVIPLVAHGRARLIAATCAAVVGLLGVGVANAGADPLTSFSVTPSSQVAGAHGDYSVQLGFQTAPYPADDNPTGDQIYPVALAKQITVGLPPGVLGNPASMGTCGEETVETDPDTCPEDSEVGVLQYEWASPYATSTKTGQPIPYTTAYAPVINQAPQNGDTAVLALPVIQGLAVVHIDVTVRDTSDYGLDATITGLPSAQPIIAADVDLWGVPSDSSHSGQRLACYDGNTQQFDLCHSAPGSGDGTFMVNPTNCAGPRTAAATVDYYDDPTPSTAQASLPAFTGCSSLAFSPTLTFAPSTNVASEPAAFTAQLTVPQADPSDTTPGDTSADVNSVSLALPPGVALSPGVADGLTACTDAQFAYGADGQTCPQSSDVGTVTVVSPLLSQDLVGSVYIGEQESSDPASGQMYRILLDAVGQGVEVKLIGAVAANPSTGQLTATFPQNPQVPFSSLQLSFKGGPRAPLANPPTCGTATSNSSISSYADPGAAVAGASSYAVAGNCALPSEFTPYLTAGTQSSQAGASAPLVFTLSRPDGEQDISGIPQVTLPLGLNATIAGVPQCSDAAAAAAACPAGSQVGTATIGAGPGTAPFYLQNQGVYLTGPYNGAPYGLAVVIDAVAGPFNLGTVVVRQALFVNPTTAQVTIKSDPLPTILGGVPLHVQSISLDIDRPGFIRLPTSCSAGALTADVTGSPLGEPATVVDGDIGYGTSTASTVTLSQPFQMGGCGALPFSPKLAVTLSGKGRTRTDSHPRLTAIVTQAAGQADLHSVKVALPLSVALDPNNSEHVCPVQRAYKLDCPRSTIVGHATADTPILPDPLSGNVYLVQGLRTTSKGEIIRTLPALSVPLDGPDHVAINLSGKTTVNGRKQLVTTFFKIPDAAISRFSLRITGGKHGILVVTGGRNLCRGPQVGTAQESGHNGKAHDASVAFATPACRAVKKKK